MPISRALLLGTAVVVCLSCASGAGQAASRPTTAWQLTAIGVQGAWPLSRGEGETIAFIDSGLDASRLPELGHRVVKSVDLVGDGSVDNLGHGTGVAAAAAAAGDLGVWGVAPRARLLIARVASAGHVAQPADIAGGIRWALTNGATVINLSLGTPREEPAIASAVDLALAAGVIVVAAGGDTLGSAPLFPASMPGVLSARAVDQEGTPGPRANPLAAGGLNVPGIDIPSLSIDMGGAAPTPALISGSSIAAALLSGAVALIESCSQKRGHRAGMTDIVRALRESATDRPVFQLSTAMKSVGC